MLIFANIFYGLMAGQFDKTTIAFSRPPADVPRMILGAVTLILLLIAFGVAAGSGLWPLAAILAFSLLAAGSYIWVGFVDSRRIVEPRINGRISWQSALPEVQRQNINIEVGELSRLLDVETGQLSDLQSAYIVAEDLALRQIQHEEDAALIRHISIGKVPFDAVLLKHNRLICCEVAFLVTPDIRQEKIEAMTRKAAAVKQVFEKAETQFETRLMLILITQLSENDESRLRRTLGTKRFADTPVDIDIRLLDFEALQRIYITD